MTEKRVPIIIKRSIHGREIEIATNKKIILRSREYYLLQELLIHGVMQSRSVHDFIRTFIETSIHSNSISNRIRKLIETGVLAHHKEKLTGKWSSGFRHHYMLGPVGVAILEKEGVILPEEAKSILQKNEQNIPPCVEEVAASIIANEIFLDCYYNQDVFDLSHQQAINHKSVQSTSWFQSTFLNQPHWIFETDVVFICLIINLKVGVVGRRSYRVEHLVQHYEELKQLAESQGKEFILVLSILDSSLQLIPEERLPNISKRVKDMKMSLLSTVNVKNTMEILVLPASRTVKMLSSILTNQIAVTATIRSFDFSIYFTYASILGTSVERVENHVFRNKKMVDDVYILSGKQKTERVLVFYGVEGSVTTLFRLIWSIQTLNREHESSSTSLWVIYETPDQAECDLLPVYRGVELWLSDECTWDEEATVKNRVPTMFKVNSLGMKSRKEYPL